MPFGLSYRCVSASNRCIFPHSPRTDSSDNGRAVVLTLLFLQLFKDPTLLVSVGLRSVRYYPSARLRCSRPELSRNPPPRAGRLFPVFVGVSHKLETNLDCR